MSFLLSGRSPAKPGNDMTSQGLLTPVAKLDEHTNTVFCCAFSDHKSSSDIDLATASYDLTTRIWDVSKVLSGNKKAQSKSVL